MQEKAGPPHRRKNGRSKAADIQPWCLDGLGGRAVRDSKAPVVECPNLVERLEEKSRSLIGQRVKKVTTNKLRKGGAGRNQNAQANETTLRVAAARRTSPTGRAGTLLSPRGSWPEPQQVHKRKKREITSSKRGGSTTWQSQRRNSLK